MLDTRRKILTPADALAQRAGGTVFVGYFDVLTAPLVRRIQEIEGPVTVVILDPPTPLLTRQARAELAASLSQVEVVIPLAGDPDLLLQQFLQQLNPDRIVHWEAEDSARTQQLIKHVQKRYRSQ